MRVDATLNKQLGNKLRAIAEQENKSISNTIRMLIADFKLDNHVKGKHTNDELQR